MISGLSTARVAALAPWHVFAIAAIAGLMKPSDMVMRHALVAQTVRPDMLLGALAGSLVVGANRLPLRPARAMLLGGAAWFVAILAFGQTRTLVPGLALLFVPLRRPRAGGDVRHRLRLALRALAPTRTRQRAHVSAGESGGACALA